MRFDHLRKDFPFLSQIINGHSVSYLDNASTSQKPQMVLDAVMNFYQTTNANIGRGIYTAAEQATQMYESVRNSVARFIGALSSKEIIFTASATDSINLVAYAWALEQIESGDEIVVTELEHHANLLPWQFVAQQVGAKLSYIPILSDGTLDLNNLDTIITKRTKLVAVAHSSNALGCINDIETIITHAHAVGARVLVDAAQSVPHRKIDVQQLKPDFLVFSGHKMLAPTGIGILYAAEDVLDEMRPYRFGGGMVQEVFYDRATWLQSPQKFEAGTPPIAQAIGLGAAIDYVQQHIDFSALEKYEASLCQRFIAGLSQYDKVRILGPVDQLQRSGHLVSFIVDGMHAHDVAAFLDGQAIAVRAGNHCAQLVAKKHGYDASVRASFYFYTRPEDIDRLLDAITAVL